MKTLYLDVCTLCRPFDDQQQLLIRLETDAILLIQRHIENKNYRAIKSPVHSKEVSAIRNTEERLEIERLINRYKETPADIDKSAIRQRAENLHSAGLGIADAAHVAFAEKTADAFLTCDDKLLKKCKTLDIDVITSNPVEFVSNEELK